MSVERRSGSHEHERLSPGAALAHLAIRLYRAVTQHRPTPCRYVPTCSAYGLQALECHGLVCGGWLTVRRLCRCTPWAARRGWDPVPGHGDLDTDEATSVLVEHELVTYESAGG